MPGVIRILALIALLSGAVALAACGDGDTREARNAYVRELNTVQASYASTLTGISQQLTAKSSPSQARRTLKRFQAAIAAQAKTLQNITTPSEVEAEHKQIVDATVDFGKAVESANDLLRDPTLRNIERWQGAIATASQALNTRIDNATTAINSKLGATKS